MSGHLIQSRKHVTTLVVEELKMFGYRRKGGSCTVSSRAGIATSIDDVVNLQSVGERARAICKHPTSIARPTRRKQELE